MSVTKQSVQYLVSAFRKTLRLSDILSAEVSFGATTELDIIVGIIEDTILSLSDEHPEPLETSVTDQLLRNLAVPDSSVADAIFGNISN